MSRRASFSCLAAVATMATGALVAEVAVATDKVTALDIEVVHPTVISGGVDWKIYGDDNRNASVTLEYRDAGSTQWRKGLDLFRLQNEDMNAYPDGYLASSPTMVRTSSAGS